MYLLRDFDEVLTLQKAYEKKGRSITLSDLSNQKKSSVLFDKGKIIWVGELKKIPQNFRRKSIKEISYKHHTLLPGFVECHTHSAFLGSRSHEFELRQNGVSYQEIARLGGGIQSTVSAVREGSHSELSKQLTKRVQRFIRQGVTTLEVKSGYGLNLKSELDMLKAIKKSSIIRTVGTFLGPHALPREYTRTKNYIEDLCSTYLPKIKKSKLCNRVDIFIEEGFFSIEEGKRYLECAKALGFDFAVHAEQLSRSGSAVISAALGAKSVDHLVCLTDADIQTLAHLNTTCVLLPTADLYLKIPYPKARKMLDAGARVALATDFNPGTSPTQDLSLVGLLARLEMKMTLPEVISAYTVGASFALGLENKTGSLTPGKSADAICIEGSWTDLFYAAGYSPVKEVWSQGKQIKII